MNLPEHKHIFERQINGRRIRVTYFGERIDGNVMKEIETQFKQMEDKINAKMTVKN